MSKVEIRNLSKELKKRTVLNHVNYVFEPGIIYGIYGRNGSGKTMLLRAIAGLIFPTEGEIYIDGEKLHEKISFPESVGVIIENTSLMPQYDAFTNLKLLADINKKVTDDEIREVIQTVGLEADSKKKVKEFSLGMKQKLAIAQAIFESPSLLLLDEPTNALDDVSVDNVRNLLLEHKKRGATILVASHNKEDIEILADKKVKMTDGKLEEME